MKENYISVEYPEPHIGRTKEMLKKYPELKKLVGNNPWTALWTVMIVGLQFAVAYLMIDQPWWVVLIAAWTVGAVCDHALFVVIHETAHNLIFKKAFWSKAMGIFANLPSVFPSAIGFRNFHLLHHRFQGELGWDADLAGPKEAAWVGNSTIKKMIWLLGFAYIEGVVRPSRVNRVTIFEPWALANAVVSVGTALLVAYFWGWAPFFYLVFSLLFSVGLHPLGGRWIQEHYVFRPGQETYSYYGLANRIAFNVGYHNEHHDLMVVPWNRLKKIKEIAPEYYDSLHAHYSWTGVLLKFLFDKNMTLWSRVIREDHNIRREKKKIGTQETQKFIDTARELSGVPADSSKDEEKLTPVDDASTVSPA